LPIDSTSQIPRLIRSLGRHSPVRQVAEAILTGAVPSEGSSRILLDRLSIPKASWKEQAVSAWCIGRMPLDPDDRAEAARILAQILSRRPARSTGCFVVSGCLFMYLGFIWLAYTSAVDGVRNRVRAAAAESLGLLGLPESAAPLAEAVAEMKGHAASADRSVRVAAAAALPGVLHNLPESGYGRFSAQTVQDLCRLLASKEDEAVLAGLDCLQLMGTGAAIPPVERVMYNYRNPDVQEVARRTRGTLIERRRKEQLSETLLRATVSPEAPEKELLRPARSAGEADDVALLRAAEGEVQENPPRSSE